MKKTVLITGVSGEVGYGLVKNLSEKKNYRIIALDIKKPDEKIYNLLDKFYESDILDKTQIDKIFSTEKVTAVFHLASILSTGGEKNPELATDINIVGTLNLIKASTLSGIKNKYSVKFIFPSSIAAYGDPITIYGISKKACEKIGIYYSKHYKLLDTEINRDHLIDFRCVRFPGLLSPDTLPSGGTSDYGPEMVHTVAQNKKYECFVRPDTTIPFMAMDDATDILIKLLNAPKNKLTKNVYDLSGFSVSAKQIEKVVKLHFPTAEVEYKINEQRQVIVDSWPKKVNSIDATNDWGYKIKYNFEDTFSKYLIPKIIERYQKS